MPMWTITLFRVNMRKHGWGCCKRGVRLCGTVGNCGHGRTTQMNSLRHHEENKLAYSRKGKWWAAFEQALINIHPSPNQWVPPALHFVTFSLTIQRRILIRK
ncbi:uncharacterized protein [Physcomitrium patens]|uniref:uncharacterized protein n=1 Tax=Physcomitrium patens TaxID=3218 RepID=UPI003CCDA570